jgi:hypothetical protein
LIKTSLYTTLFLNKFTFFLRKYNIFPNIKWRFNQGKSNNLLFYKDQSKKVIYDGKQELDVADMGYVNFRNMEDTAE